jgi:hypothetical protein
VSRAARPVRPFGWPVILVLLAGLAVRWAWGALGNPPPLGLRGVPAGIVRGFLASALPVVAAAFLPGPDSPHRRGGTRA